MASNLKGAVMANATAKHSNQLQRNLAAVAKSLAGRPQELRGPFAVCTGKAVASAASQGFKKK